jgi:hypothetical protein
MRGVQSVVTILSCTAGAVWCIFCITAVRLKVEQNQLVGVFDEIGILFDGLKGA